MKIGVYIQAQWDRASYTVESFEMRSFAGLMMVKDSLEQSGREVGYCGEATVGEWDVVLASIVSACDWFSFIAERRRWKGFKGKVVVGGAGVVNTRAMRAWFDYAVLGRGERVILGLISALEAGDEPQDPSVVSSETFSMEREYVLAQAECLYPREINLRSSRAELPKMWSEKEIGCPYGCLFCQYAHQRAPMGSGFNVGHGFTEGRPMGEMTMLQTADTEPSFWFARGNLLMGLDGFSERLRRMVHKPISDELLRHFLAGCLTLPKAYPIRLFNIIGYPTETREEWHEFYEVLAEVDGAAGEGPKWFMSLQSTPFCPSPVTPAACWPAEYRDYRLEVKKELGALVPDKWRFFEGKRWTACETFSTESLSRTIRELLIHRGVEGHEKAVEAVATNRKFKRATSDMQVRMMEGLFDTRALFAAHTWETLPTRNLRGWRSRDLLERSGELSANRFAQRPSAVRSSSSLPAELYDTPG